MKYKGKKLEGLNTEPIIIPRAMGNDIVFIAEAVSNYDEFEKLCPLPEPPEILRPGGRRERNFKDPAYEVRLREYATQKTNWALLVSLSATKDLEWETVDMSDPKTWANWKKELQESGFSEIEMMRILRGVARANCLDDEMLEEARESFIRSREEQSKVSSSLPDEQ